MRLVIVSVVALAAAACTSETKPVRDVQYLMEHPEELEQLRQECRNNPGELGNTPECMNAREAYKQQIVEQRERARESRR